MMTVGVSYNLYYRDRVYWALYSSFILNLSTLSCPSV